MIAYCCVFSAMTFFFFFFTGNSKEDSVLVVLHKQPVGGVYQSFVCELFQPCAVPCSQLTSPGALGWLLHPLEPSHETSGMLSSLLQSLVYTPYVLRLLNVLFFLSRNLFTSATRSCWRSVLSCRREWTSCSER